MESNLFVYGTLREGLGLHWALRECRWFGNGTVRGRLYDLGAYPGLKEGSLCVRGECYSVAEDTLQLIDRLEGFRPDDPEGSLFERRRVAVELDAGVVTDVWCYFYMGTTEEEHLIREGDYVEFLDGVPA